jgi:hypothetical protein
LEKFGWQMPVERLLAAALCALSGLAGGLIASLRLCAKPFIALSALRDG